jgi:hypothetical protein
MNSKVRVVGGLAAIAVIVAVGGCADDGDATPSATPSRTAPQNVSMIRSGSLCEFISTTPAPEWVDAAGPGLPSTQVRSEKGDVVAALFADPLKVAPRKDGANNKILFIVGPPRDGKPLTIKATPADGGAAVTATSEANSGPGEIYPSIVDFSKAGCWHLELSWNGHTDTMDVVVQP